MARKKKSVSFDAMVKFFMQQYDIPTKKDVKLILDRLDRLETLIQQSTGHTAAKSAASVSGNKSAKPIKTASDTVLDSIRRFPQGAGFAEIQARTGYGDKKLRNIIFRLHSKGKIKRQRRGIYVVSR
jgi:hypothetical protein